MGRADWALKTTLEHQGTNRENDTFRSVPSVSRDRRSMYMQSQYLSKSTGSSWSSPAVESITWDCCKVLKPSLGNQKTNATTFSVKCSHDCFKYRCPQDTTMDYSYDPTRRFQEFKIRAFRFFNEYDTVFFHCELLACHRYSPNSRWVKAQRYYVTVHGKTYFKAYPLDGRNR